MQKLAEICVHRPVFASMLIAAITVVGGVSFFTLGRRPLPAGRDAGRVGHDHQPRRDAGEHRDRGHRPHRSRGQHGLRHRRAALDLDRRPLARHDFVRPLQERRHRGAGGSREGRSGHPRSSRNRGSPGRAEAGSGLLSDPDVLGVGADAGRRADDVPRAERAEAPRVGQRRRRGAALRRAAAGDPGPDRPRPAQRLRPLDDRRRRGPALAEPGAARRPSRAGQPRALGPHPRPPAQPRRLQRSRRRHARELADSHPRHRTRRRYRRGADVGLDAQRPARPDRRRAQAERRQHGRAGRRHQGPDGRDPADAAAQRPGRPRPRRLRVHQGLARRHRRTPGPRRHPRGHHRPHLPAQLPHDAHRRGRHPDLDHRRVRRHRRARLHAQPDDDARPDPHGRHRHRRRHRRAGEHLPVRRREGHVAVPGGDRRHARDRAGGHGDDAGAARGLHPGRLPRRDRRAVHVVVRADVSRGDRHQPDRLVHADADAGGALDQAQAHRGRQQP